MSASPVSIIAILKDLRRMNESLRSRGALRSTEIKPYVEGITRSLEYLIQRPHKFYRTLELAFDPGDFVCGPSKIIARVRDQRFGEPRGDR